MFFFFLIIIKCDLCVYEKSSSHLSITFSIDTPGMFYYASARTTTYIPASIGFTYIIIHLAYAHL